MTRLLTHGNESGDTPSPSTSGTVNTVTSPVYHGTNAWSFASATAFIEWTISTVLGRHYFVRAFLRLDDTPTLTESRLIEVLNTLGNSVGSVRVHTTRALRLCDGAGNVLATSSALAVDTWYMVELEVMVPSSGNGVVALRLDGTSVGSSSSASNGTTAINRFRFGRNAVNPGVLVYADRIALNDDQGGSDNSFPGGVGHQLAGEIDLTLAMSGTLSFLAGEPSVATTDLIEIQRSDDGGQTWLPVRTLEGEGLATPVDDLLDVWDYEAPNGDPVVYRVRALHDYNGVFAASDWAGVAGEWESNVEWLKHPLRPSLNMPVTIRAYPDRKRDARRGVFQPMGRDDLIVISDSRGGPTGTVVLHLDDEDDQEALDELVATEAVLLLQCAAGERRPERYLRLGNQDRSFAIDKAWSPLAFDSFEWVEVARPEGAVDAWPEP